MTTKSSAPIIGIDLGDRKHAVCVLSQDGELLEESKIDTTRESLALFSQKYPAATIAMEVGMMSPWTSRYLQQRQHRVIVANSRKLRAIYKNPRKSDRKDAEMLARLARVDETLLGPIKHGSEEAQRDLLQIKLRDNLVRQRVDIISGVRFSLKSLGVKTRSPKTSYFSVHVRRELANEHDDLLSFIEPSLQVLDTISEQVKELDKRIADLAAVKYPETAYLMQMTGVGALTALTFVLTIEDPGRFSRARDVGAYLGLVPKRDQSGDIDKQLRITKAGDTYLRRLLVGAAQYMLGPFGKDCDLKRHGEELAARGGARAKKKAVVAIARKLSILLLTLWKNKSAYEPLKNQPQAA